MISAGRLFPGAGALADAYADAGGAVRWFGKPCADVYAAVFARFPAIGRARTMAVGDSIEHDIAGAKRAGARGALVRTGILAGCDEAALAAEAARHGATPDFLLPRFA
jgi:ribonucleotide monophosphatase NagD (HAD superfamily)